MSTVIADEDWLPGLNASLVQGLAALRRLEALHYPTKFRILLKPNKHGALQLRVEPDVLVEVKP